MLPLNGTASVAKTRTHDVEVLAHCRCRMLEMQAPHRFDGDLVADAEAKDEAATRHLVERGGHLDHRRRVPRVDREDCCAKGKALRRVGISRKDEGRVARIGQLSNPHGLDAKPFGNLDPRDGLVEGLHCIDGGGKARHGFSNIFP